MKVHVITSVVVMGGSLLVSGCRSPSGPAQPVAWVRDGSTVTDATRPSFSTAEDLNKQRDIVQQLEGSLADQREAQARLNRQLDDLRKEIYQSALQVRDVKTKADQMAGLQVTNAAVLKTMENEVATQRALLSAMETNIAAAPKEAAALRAALQNEQQQRDKEAALSRERDKEIQDLKKSNEAKDALINQQSAAAATQAAKTSPAPVAPPAAKVASVMPPAAPVAATAQPAPSAVVIPADAKPSKLVAEANVLLRKRDVDGATKLFQAALDRDPGLVSARLGLAACYYTRANLPEAKKIVADVLSVDPSNAQALGLDGIIQWQQGNLREASDALEAAIKMEPNDSQLHNYMGIVYHDRKRQDDAVREMRKAVELDSDNVEARFNLAVLLATAKPPLLDEARRNYELVLTMGSARDSELDKILYGAPKP